MHNTVRYLRVTSSYVAWQRECLLVPVISLLALLLSSKKMEMHSLLLHTETVTFTVNIILHSILTPSILPVTYTTSSDCCHY